MPALVTTSQLAGVQQTALLVTHAVLGVIGVIASPAIPRRLRETLVIVRVRPAEPDRLGAHACLTTVEPSARRSTINPASV
tara:strand:+ start:529 stop:771 length:243 start_codon:yes stop_codon:yes gene_type:complete